MMRRFTNSFASYFLVGIVALLPRVLDLGRFITEDEANFWLDRSDIFLQAIRTGNFAATAVTDHPGVTTMWLGAAGLSLRRMLFSYGLLQDESFATILGTIRLPVALTHVAAIVIGYWLLRRLVPRIALLGALLWAVDPFVIGYSRLLHVDALAGTFMTVSLLAACCYWYRAPQRGMLVLSATCGALAFLSKSPALILLPSIVLIAALSHWIPGEDGIRRFKLGALLGALGAWFVIAIVAAAIFWPAIWAAPAEAAHQIQLGIFGEGAQPHQLGNFFLGKSDPSPGLLFYPVALFLRLTPITLAGLVLLPFAWWRTRPERRVWLTLLALACFVILFTGALSVFPKKFNRYLEPAFPALDILAAAGWIWTGKWLSDVIGTSRKRLGHAVALLSTWLVTAAALVNVWWWHPYEIVAFNQVLGGAPAGSHAFITGWGEGLEQVASWLNQQPDITNVVTVTTMRQGLQEYLKRGAQSTMPNPGDLPPHTGYVVIYREQMQMGWLDQPPFSLFYGHTPPLYTVKIHGVEYAWVYAAPPSAEQRTADFGDQIHLYGYQQSGPAQRGQTLHLTLVWGPKPTLPPGLMFFVHLLGPDGQRVAQVDLPYAPADWAPQRYTTSIIPLAVPPDLPAGSYRLVLGCYDGTSGQRLPLTGAEALDPAVDGAEALLVTEIAVP